MKTKLICFARFIFLLISVFIISAAFSGNNSSKGDDDNSCTVYVKYKNGSVAEGIKVTTDVCGSISCVGGRNFYTDKDGKATVKWVKGCKLCTIYIKGTGHKDEYKKDETYNFTLD